MKISLKKLSKAQKLEFSILIIAGCLFFYAVGIATGFFGLPIFSGFWIVSNETAHGVLLIRVLAVAVAISAVSILVAIMKPTEQSTVAKDTTGARPNVEKKSVNRQAQIARASAKIDDIEHKSEYSANTQSSNSQPETQPPSINVETNQQASIPPKEISKPQPPQLPKINNEKKQTPISKNQKKKKQNKKTAPKA